MTAAPHTPDQHPEDRTVTPEEHQQRISELAGIAIDARLNLADAIREACSKPHAYVQHRDHQPAWCNTCGRGDNGVVYGKPAADHRARQAAATETVHLIRERREATS